MSFCKGAKKIYRGPFKHKLIINDSLLGNGKMFIEMVPHQKN